MFSCVLARFLTGIGMMPFTLLCYSLCTRKYWSGKTGFFFFSLKPEFPSCLSKAGVTGRYMVYISQGYKRQAFSILFPSSYPAPLHDMILGSEFWKNVRCSQPIRGYQLYAVSQSTDVIDEPERHPCFTEYNEMGRFLSYLSCSIRFYLYWHFLIGDPMVVLEYGFDCWNWLVYKLSWEKSSRVEVLNFKS